MFEETASSFYELHCREAIIPKLSREQKVEVAQRISELTLKAPIWLDRETDYNALFPEVTPYVNTKLTGLYLCAIMTQIVRNLQEMKT